MKKKKIKDKKEKIRGKNKKDKNKIEDNYDTKEKNYNFARLLDRERILNKTKNKENLKVTLLHDNIKGTGLYATKNIICNETIAYYKIKIHNQATYISPTNFVYTFSIYGPLGKKCEHLIGDIDDESIPDPENNIPYWGIFINEPNRDQDINAEVDINTDENYTNIGRKRIKCGIYMIYKIIAKREINEGEEITIYYGDEYNRNYELFVKI